MAERGDHDLPPAVLRAGLLGITALLRAAGPLRNQLGSAGGLVVYAASRRRGLAARNHMRRSPDLTPAAARRLARSSYAAYGRITLDFLWATGLDVDTVARNSRVIGMGHVDEALASGRGAVLALTHFGNWDMAALIALSRGLRLTTVMAPIGAPWMTRLVVWARRRNGLEVFAPDRAARQLVRALRQGRVVALLCDIPGAGPEVVVEYCGGPVAFSAAPAWLTLRTGARLLPVTCRVGHRGEPPYVITCRPAVLPAEGDDERALMQRVAASVEGDVDADPAQWYPFGAVYADAPWV